MTVRCWIWLAVVLTSDTTFKCHRNTDEAATLVSSSRLRLSLLFTQTLTNVLLSKIIITHYTRKTIKVNLKAKPTFHSSPGTMSLTPLSHPEKQKDQHRDIKVDRKRLHTWQMLALFISLCFRVTQLHLLLSDICKRGLKLAFLCFKTKKKRTAVCHTKLPLWLRLLPLTSSGRSPHTWSVQCLEAAPQVLSWLHE